MAAPKFNSKSPTIRRILKEAAELTASPSRDYTAAPLESDLFEWHFTLRGPPSSAFAAGLYHGRIVLPPSYPLRPPAFRFLTPSGRFEPNREICLSISGHHEETWQPAWGVRTALVALRSFMETDAAGQLGGLDASPAVRRELAERSRAWRCGVCCVRVADGRPDDGLVGLSNEEIMRECEEKCRQVEQEKAAAEEGGGGNNGSTGGGSGGGGGDGGKKKGEETVPPELTFGFRDEIAGRERKAGREREVAGTPEPAGRSGDEDDTGRLAEGFVRTSAAGPRATRSLPARPAPRRPGPTRTVPPPDLVGRPQQPGAQRLAATRAQHDPNAGVPAWVDYAIISLVGLLIAMLLKILLGF